MSQAQTPHEDGLDGIELIRSAENGQVSNVDESQVTRHPLSSAVDANQQSPELVSEFADPLFTIDILHEARQGNFLPALSQLAAGHSLDMRVCDDVGFALIHYAVVTGNMNAVKAFLDADPKCLTYVSKTKQDTLMAAVTHSNAPMLRLALENFPNYSFESRDDWGFTALTYCIKNNFVVGVLYMLAKGASLSSDIVDINKCTYAHWACHMDRRFILGLLFRADMNFKLQDKVDMTPWDRAVNNWSLGAMNFLMDFSQRPLKTLYFLRGDREAIREFDLLPELPQKRAYEIESTYFKEKLLHQKRLRMGMYRNLWATIKHGCCVYLPTFVRVFWDRNNIRLGLATKVYFLFLAAVIFHAQFSFDVWSLHTRLAVALGLLSFFCLMLGSSLGRSSSIHYAMTKIGVKKPKRSALQFDEYYVPQEEYDRYLTTFGLTNSIYERVQTLVEEGDFDTLGELKQEEMCSICGIFKPQKTRHCPNVNLCVRDYQMYSYYWDQPISSLNEFKYFGWLVLDALFLITYLLAWYCHMGAPVLDQGFVMIWLNVNYLLWTTSQIGLLLLHLIISYALTVKFFNIIVFCYCITKNLTIDEIYNPHYYPYLFRKKLKPKALTSYEEAEKVGAHMVFLNPNQQSWQENVSAFIKRGRQGPIYTS